MLTDKLIESFAKRVRVTNHIEEKHGMVSLVTQIHLGNTPLYSHSLDMEPLITLMLERVEKDNHTE